MAYPGKKLGCTSQDVKIARVTDITPLSGIFKKEDGSLGCFTGARISFTANFEVLLGASGSARYDIGLYVAQNQMQALTGTCNSSIITDTNAHDTFINLDPSPDTCGDITGVVGSGYNPQTVNMRIDTTCNGSGGKLLLPNCTSWRIPGSNGTCTSIADAYPGTSSKCNCDNGFTIDVDVETVNLSVAKSADPTQVTEPGGKVTYDVLVTNPAEATTVTLTALTEDDTNDGTVDSTYNSTSDPKLSEICDKVTLAPQASATCSFERQVKGYAAIPPAPITSITDQACVSGTTPNGPIGPVCDTASVSIANNTPTAAVVKDVKKAVCATVRYGVKVTNTDPWETLTLTALNDNMFGNITQKAPTNSKVKDTTCNVTQTLDAGKYYICTFDAEICEGLSGIMHSNTVTATLKDAQDTTVTAPGSATVYGVTVVTTPPPTTP